MKSHTTGSSPAPSAGDSPGRVLAFPAAFAALILAIALSNVQQPHLFKVLLGSSVGLLFWIVGLFLAARRSKRRLTLDFVLRKNHWVQVLAQIPLYIYWGWHARFVYAFIPLILAQLAFAYGIDSLLTWSRRDRYGFGVGPSVVVLSINLFIWFKPEWFVWQFAMIALCYVAKEFLRWTKNGRSAHIFNPSSFPLAVFSLVLIVTASSDVTYGNLIANTQSDPSYMYLAIFLASLPGQIVFGVARMTLSAVITSVGIGLVYFMTTGTYLFFDAFIPVPVFLGMHLLFTDPSTSPRTELGRVLFGVLYALGVLGCFLILSRLEIPTFYDKLLPVPIMNLMVRRIDRLSTWRPLAILDPARLGRGLTPRRRDLVYASVWTLVFTAMSATQVLGDKHPGQYLPFWSNACEAGSTRACEYAQYLTLSYCMNGSGWACNERGVWLEETGGSGSTMFERGCGLGFTISCANSDRTATSPAALERAGPLLGDLPIVLRGTKPPLREREPGKLYAIGCEQGWPGMCNRP